jgi:hypothetical protein
MLWSSQDRYNIVKTKVAKMPIRNRIKLIFNILSICMTKGHASTTPSTATPICNNAVEVKIAAADAIDAVNPFNSISDSAMASLGTRGSPNIIIGIS